MEAIMKLINTFDGEVYDLCYEILQTYGEHEEVFEFVCKNFEGVPEQKLQQIDSYFSEDEIDEYESVYGDTVNGLLNSTIKKCNLGLISEEEFYKSLWNAYCTIFENRKEKAFAFYYTIIDSTIPYLYLGKPLSMTNERFKELLDINKSFIDKIRYITKSRYSQKTERASLVLNCLDSIGDFESKTVVLAQAISLLGQSRSSRTDDLEALAQRIRERLEDLEKDI